MLHCCQSEARRKIPIANFMMWRAVGFFFVTLLWEWKIQIREDLCVHPWHEGAMWVTVTSVAFCSKADHEGPLHSQRWKQVSLNSSQILQSLLKQSSWWTSSRSFPLTEIPLLALSVFSYCCPQCWSEVILNSAYADHLCLCTFCIV